MAITLTHDGVTVALSDRLVWVDEYSWSPIEQAIEYSTTGALLIDVGEKFAGQPITLEGTETSAWITRATCDVLRAWAALPGVVFQLVLRGQTHDVVFDHEGGGFDARPVWNLSDGEQSADQVYLPTYKFLKV